MLVQKLSRQWFPIRASGLVVGGLLPLVDSLRRFGIFSKVRLSIRNSRIHPWSFSGGQVKKTDISLELTVENNKETDLLIRSIEIHAPISVTNAVGESKNRIRLVDMEKIGNDAFQVSHQRQFLLNQSIMLRVSRSTLKHQKLAA
ncbi:MAG: hypothetical protein U0989_20530 [Azonexus sp.]|nr:hypothetical protein [Azonexus sp.]